MRRIISVLAVAALMAAMLVVSALPAFAAASDNASCKGALFSGLEPGTKGQLVSEVAKQGVLGEILGGVRSCHPNANPQGGGTGSGGV